MSPTDHSRNRGREQNNLSAQENAERFEPIESLGTGTERTKREELRPTLPIVRIRILWPAGDCLDRDYATRGVSART